MGDTIQGLPLEIGAAVSLRAQSDEVLVSSTVRDLVAGSGIAFTEDGLAALGDLGEWRLYRVATT